MKTAQFIAVEESAADAMELATKRAIAVDQNWTLELSKYTFDDNSVLAFRGCEYYGYDADDAESVRGYAVWLWTNCAGASDADLAAEHVEIIRLLEGKRL